MSDVLKGKDRYLVLPDDPESQARALEAAQKFDPMARIYRPSASKAILEVNCDRAKVIARISIVGSRQNIFKFKP